MIVIIGIVALVALIACVYGLSSGMFISGHAIDDTSGTGIVMDRYNNSANNSTVSVIQGASFMIELPENPTTGYQWNVTVTEGLTIANDEYVCDNPGIAGAGGIHNWNITASGEGAHQFKAVYMRSWEPLTGSEEMFVLNVDVSKN